MQARLAQATELSVDQIQALNIKPDLKRAMLFVCELGHSERSVTTAELLAEIMIKNSQPTSSVLCELWQYDGVEFPIKCKGSNWITLMTPFVFLKKSHMAFVGHNWVNLQEDQNLKLIQNGSQIGMADQIMYNQKTQELIQKRHM